MENKIQLQNISKKYANFTLDNLSFSIPKGYITGFIGKNGAGKSTTIKSILSLIHLDSGKILYQENHVKRLAFLQTVGLVMDEAFLAKDWNMKRVNAVMKIGYEHWDEALFFTYLEKFAIDNNTKVKNLSRGMKIKLMLGIALSHKATTLILDEPTSGLDPSMRDEFTDMMKEFIQDEENTVLFSTHITQDLEAIADYIAFIDNGKLIDFDNKDDFLDNYQIIKGYPEQLNLLPAEAICGKKVNDMGFACLVRKNSIADLGEEFIQEKATLDQILVLYGRE